MAKRGRLCVVPECERQVTPGALVCVEHRQTALGKELGREVALLTQQVTTLERAEQEGERREAARAFRQQVMRGEYAALFSSKFHEMLQTAGEDESLKGEIGMLRVAMVRVMTEEEDPSRMAHALAKLSFAVGRAMKQEREWNGADAQEESLADLINEILADVGNEDQEMREPWMVNPFHPSDWMKREMQAEGLEPGTVAGATWIQQWQRQRMRELAAEGNGEALRRLGPGVLGGGE